MYEDMGPDDDLTPPAAKTAVPTHYYDYEPEEA